MLETFYIDTGSKYESLVVCFRLGDLCGFLSAKISGLSLGFYNAFCFTCSSTRCFWYECTVMDMHSRWR